MFRGHADAEWYLVPTLFRPPLDQKIVERRRKHTDEFMNALANNAHHLKLKHLSEQKLLAIAQHYGFHTRLLDFTLNLEVAAYFATYTERPPRIGAIFSYPIDEYEQLRNPFAALGTSLEEAEEILGDSALPQIVDEDFSDVPRIYQQEGVFIDCPANKTNTVQENCIDRYYFYQRAGSIYRGKFAFEIGVLSPNWFSTREAFESYMRIARRDHPELFKQTVAFDTVDLFPPIDDLSVFAMEWKKGHSDRTLQHSSSRNPFSFLGKWFSKTAAKDTVAADPHSDFAAAVDKYYFDKERRTPYETHLAQQGRRLIESLRHVKELDNVTNQRWLLWELLKSTTDAGKYRCGVKLNNRAKSGAGEDSAFHLMIIDRWLEASYFVDLPIADARAQLWQVHFDQIRYRRWDPKPEMTATHHFFSAQKQNQPVKGNPYNSNAAIERVLESIKKQFSGIEDGADGSFVYDLQYIVMGRFGRDLRITWGLGKKDHCCFSSPLVVSDCNKSEPPLSIEIYEGFFPVLKRTSVCSNHWKYYLEAEVDLFDPRVQFQFGLA